MQHARHSGNKAIGLEWLRATQHLVKHQAKRENIGAAIIGLLREHLWSHVSRRAAQRASHRGQARRGRIIVGGESRPARNAKVQNFYPPAGVSIRFSGLMSPWTISFWWAAASPSAHWIAIFRNAGTSGR